MASISSDKIHSDKCLTFIGRDSVCAEDIFASVVVIYSSARVYCLSGPLKILHFIISISRIFWQLYVLVI